jgi:hypothetical protein
VSRSVSTALVRVDYPKDSLDAGYSTVDVLRVHCLTDILLFRLVGKEASEVRRHEGRRHIPLADSARHHPSAHMEGPYFL